MAITRETENKTKILVNVYVPVIAFMKHKLDAACLKRDAYLDKALQIEAGFLRAEVTTPNSDKAKSYIADNLKQLRLKPLNLLLSTETVELMNEVCKEKNIPRDAFINRFFLLLIATDAVIDALFHRIIHNLESRIGMGRWEDIRDEVRMNIFNDCGVRIDNFNILDNIEELVKFQPFGNLRMVFTEEPEWENLYSYVFEKNSLLKLPKEYAFLKTDNILGFNTFITDDKISEQEALDKPISANVELDKLLAFAKKEKRARPLKTKSLGETQ